MKTSQVVEKNLIVKKIKKSKQRKINTETSWVFPNRDKKYKINRSYTIVLFKFGSAFLYIKV